MIRVSDGVASASGSYPSFATRSASSFALRSAASKSNAPASTFFAPSLVFFAPRMLFFAPVALAGFRAAAGMAREVVASAVAARGEGERVVPFPFAFAFKNGDAVLVGPAAGVPVRDGGLLGRLMDGLSHDEKKSSSSPAPGVFDPLSPPSLATSSTCTSPGNLQSCQPSEPLFTLMTCPYCLASAALRLCSSSLYFVAALDVYLVLGSLLASAAPPPCV